jgi:hypothetical protein
VSVEQCLSPRPIGHYTNRQVDGNETFYKYHGENNRLGKTHTYVTKKKYSNESDLRNEAAILDEWGVNLDRVTEFKPDKGTWISEGTAAAQKGVSGEVRKGGGYQGLIDSKNLPKSAVRRTDKTGFKADFVADSIGTTVTKKAPHKNSRAYDGETHVYAVRSPDGTVNKIGESAQGTRVRDGASKRAEQQVRKLNREVGPGHTSDIRKTFPNKDAARTYETNLIERYRRMYGQDTLPGNKTNR